MHRNRMRDYADAFEPSAQAPPRPAAATLFLLAIVLALLCALATLFVHHLGWESFRALVLRR